MNHLSQHTTQANELRCLICDLGFPRETHFLKHFAAHLEEIAIFSLPIQSLNDSDDDGPDQEELTSNQDSISDNDINISAGRDLDLQQPRLTIDQMLPAGKLLDEIKLRLWEVDEASQRFDSIHASINQTTSLLLLVELKHALKVEIWRLQKSRDQIKTWALHEAIKDKRLLLEKRRMIESVR